MISETALLGIGKANTIVAHIELSVVFANEDIAQNPERTIWWWYIHAHEAGQANSFAHLGNAQNVILALQLKGLAAQHEFNDRQIGYHVTGDDVLEE